MLQGEELVVEGPGKGGGWLGLEGMGLGGLGLGLGLPSLSSVAKSSCLLCWTSREKSTVEQEIKEREESIQRRTSEVQVRRRCLSICLICLSVYSCQDLFMSLSHCQFIPVPICRM